MTDPLGTPLKTRVVLDLTPLIVTACFLLQRKDLIHCRALSCIPYALSFTNNRSWGRSQMLKSK